MNGDEQVLRGRVYGCDHDDPHPGPLRARTYATLVGGPLDGLLLDITGWTAEERDGGVAVATELSRWPGGRALYEPSPRGIDHRGQSGRRNGPAARRRATRAPTRLTG